MINNSPQSPSRISQGLKKLNNFRYNALNKLSTSSSGQEQPKNKSSTKQVSFSPARPSSKKEPGITNSIQFNRIGMNTQALQTLSNAALHVKNLLSDMLENADPEDKKVFDIDEELKRINENKNNHAMGMFSLAGDESDNEPILDWGRSKTKGTMFGRRKTKTKKKNNVGNYTMDQDSFNFGGITTIGLNKKDKEMRRKSLIGFDPNLLSGPTSPKENNKQKTMFYTIDQDSNDFMDFQRLNTSGNKVKNRNKLLSDSKKNNQSLPKNNLNGINMAHYTLDGSSQALFKKKKPRKKLQLQASSKKCSRIEEEVSEVEESKRNPSVNKEKFQRKKERHASYTCKSPQLFKKILNTKNKKKKGLIEEDSSDNSLTIIQNNENLFSKLYSKNKFNQTQILNEINLKLTQSLSNTDISIDPFGKKSVNSVNRKTSSSVIRKPSSSTVRKPSSKAIKEDTDIRNFIPLNDQKYKKFNDICEDLKDSIIMIPEKSEENSTVNPANILSINDINDINNNIGESQRSSEAEGTIKKIESLKQYKNDENTLSVEDTQSQKHDREMIKEIKYRCLTRQNKLVYDSLSDEEVDEELSGTFYIEPNCTFHIYFDMFILFFSIYSIIYTPILLCFDIYKKTSFSNWSSILDVIIDCFFIVDIFLGFITAYYDFEEQLITRLHPIAMNYLTGWFFCDLLSGFPFNTIFIIASSYQSEFVLTYISDEFKLLDLLKILRVLKLFKSFMLNSFTSTMYKFCLNSDSIAKWIRLYFSLLIFFFSVHLLSCVFIFLGQLDYPNWIYTQGYEMTEHGAIYITSFYYICATVFTIGYGDVTSVSTYERTFNLLLLVVGIMIYSWSVTSLSNYVQSVDSKTLDYQKKVAILEQIRVTHEKMPPALYDKISRFLLYKLHNEKRDKNDIVDNLPIGLRNKLIMEMYRGIINNFVFFKNFDNTDFIIRVILAFKPIQATKNERLVNEGDYIEEIIFVKRGSLALEIPLPVVIKDETLQSIQSLKKTKTSFGNYTFNKTYTNSTNNKFSFGQPDTIECNVDGSLADTKTMSRSKTKKNTNPYPEIKPVQQYIKIIEIRRNEHFGDILMFLNKRSPLSVKVKSKVAEIFLLKKTDAVEISMSFPRIWRKIIKKSLFNMEQIERLINKSLKFFFIHNEGALKRGSLTKKNYYHRDFTKKNTFLNSKKLMNSLTLNDTACELQSIPSEEEDEDDDSENEGSELVGDENEEGLSGEEGEIDDENMEEEEGEDSEENNGNNYDVIQEENSEDYGDENNTTLKENDLHEHNPNAITSENASSDSSFAKTVKTNIDNNNVDYMEDSDDSDNNENNSFGFSHNSKAKDPFGSSSHGDLISGNTLPYSAEDINKENLPFEPSIDLKENSFIPSILPNTTNNSSSNSNNNNNNNLIFNTESNNNNTHNVNSSDFTFPLKKTFNNATKKISSFNVICIAHSFGFSVYGTNANNNTGIKSPLKKTLSINKPINTNKQLKKSKSFNNPQKGGWESPVDKRRNSKMVFYQKKDMFLKDSGIDDNVDLDQINNPVPPANQNKEMTDEDKAKNMLFNNLGGGNMNGLFGNANMIPPKRGGSNSNSMLDVISANIEKNYLNLNNPKYFYSNYFSQVMNKDDPKDSSKKVVQKLKDIAKIIDDPKDTKKTNWNSSGNNITSTNTINLNQ